MQVFALDAAAGELSWSFEQVNTLLNTVALYLALSGQVIALR